jgi:hypothetical protein
MYKLIACLAILSLCISIRAQKDRVLNRIEFSGYMENYYSYDFAQPDNHKRPSFLYYYDLHNEVALNLGYLKMTYTEKSPVGSLAWTTATHTNAAVTTSLALVF